jgi:hypothetical protein
MTERQDCRPPGWPHVRSTKLSQLLTFWKVAT